MDLRVPTVNIAGRWARDGLGAFISEAAFAHFLGTYEAGMATLPPCELFDVPTTFGTVRAYRFTGPDTGAPAILLPGRNASTPMYRTNLEPLLKHRTVYGIDLLGEAGLSVQHKAVRDAPDQAQWLDETLAGLGLEKAHLLGVSMGGWTAANAAVHRPGRIASLTLLDPVFTFTGVPVKAILASVALFAPGVPERWRRRVQSWIAGGADIDAAETEAALISAGSTDFTLHTPMPKLFTDEQLRSIDVPVLALIAGRSVMLDPPRAVARARELLVNGQIELWSDASHAINGEYPEEIAQRAGRFWGDV
ncbi:alpha/beta fold hydrolase [Mycolicibacterium setense]|uniref:alpha/beta fold hydrolase n=1 Tax=Mycolicibacterium setense TaxID=431269 RepID=UPI000574216B|nr:alpha/beta hydrolase [Mycolicibacterium setense]KHO23207.1 carboxylesterase [Mycolicibacterium setense]MCV7115262.1 alpha/beta fold hydrolase [Mycolicibacterium setense]